jgi:putative IMPACT (imprinted ancient) family translation regulator
MKKSYFILLAGLLFFACSCEKKQELSTTCYCVYRYNGGMEARTSFLMRGYYQERACAKKEIELQNQYGIPNASCSLY